MLKELYILKDGVLHFYYTSENPTSRNLDDKTILSSGLFSAIQSFVKEHRSSSLSNFTTGEELFLFKTIPNDPREIVFVVDQHQYQTSQGEELIQTLSDVVTHSKLMSTHPKVTNLNSEEAVELRKGIHDATVQFYSSIDSETLQSLLRNHHEVERAFVFREDKIIAMHGRTNTKLQADIERETSLLFSVINRSLLNLRLANELRYLRTETNNGTILITKHLSSAFILVAPQNFVDSTLREVLQSHPYLNAFNEHLKKGEEAFTLETQFLLTEKGEIVFKSGSSPGPKAGIFYSTTLNALNNYSKLLVKRKIAGVTGLLGTNNLVKVLVTTKKGTEYDIQIFVKTT